MTHASLFSGIGGFDLAAEWAGWTNLFNCEIDPFCQKVLKYHFPNAEQYSDIRTTDFTVWRGRIDVLTGGFPCQPFSLAGKRRGTEDERHLWPEMLRAIREIRPRWVVGENVFGILNWSDGLVFEQVCSDLEYEGYEVQAYILPAAGVGAPHKRDRVWFVAHSQGDGCGRQGRGEGCEVRELDILSGECEGSEVWCATDGHNSERITANTGGIAGYSRRPESTRQFRSTGVADGGDGDTPDSDHEQSQRWDGEGAGGRCEPPLGTESPRSAGVWDDFPTVAPVCGRDDGFSFGLVDITFPKWRSESIKALGNAIVSQVAYQIFETINEIDSAPGRGIKR